MRLVGIVMQEEKMLVCLENKICDNVVKRQAKKCSKCSREKKTTECCADYDIMKSLRKCIESRLSFLS